MSPIVPLVKKKHPDSRSRALTTSKTIVIRNHPDRDHS